MLNEDKEWVIQVIRLELAKLPKPPKPVEVDIDGIVKLVLDKINIITTETIPKKGKEK